MFSKTNLPEPFKKKILEEKFKLMKEGDMNAKNEIIEHNLRLVIHIAQKFNDPTYEQEDLISIGTFGLIKAVDTFDLNKNTHFASYATRCIENEILMYLRNNNKRKKDISLNYSITEDANGEKLEIEDTLEDPNQDFISEYENQEIQEKLRLIVKELPEKEKYIIMMYFGFLTDSKITQKDLAEEFNISRSYVSRIIKKTLGKLEDQLKESGIIRGAVGGLTADIPKTPKNPNSPKVKVLSQKEIKKR